MSTDVRLFVDLIPQSAWFKNLRSELAAVEWDLVKRRTYRDADYLCQACGGRGHEHPVECHERWHFDEEICLQRLVRTIALCPACHEATHFGFARTQGRGVQAKAHLMKVNAWSNAVADKHIDDAMRDWSRRNLIKWRLDASWLISFVQLSAATEAKIRQSYFTTN